MIVVGKAKPISVILPKKVTLQIFKKTTELKIANKLKKMKNKSFCLGLAQAPKTVCSRRCVTRGPRQHVVACDLESC
jgi:hypothetical protein